MLDVFLAAGQSNAAGRGTGSTITPRAGCYELIWQGTGDLLGTNSGLVNLADPTTGAVNGSAWPAFADRYVELTGRPVAVCVRATGGTAQSVQASTGPKNHWDENAGDATTTYGQAVTVFTESLAQLATAGVSYSLKGMVWAQGERDGQSIDLPASFPNITKAVYKAALIAMIDRWRTVLSSAQLPFFVVRTGRELSGDTSGFQQVRDAQDETCASNPFTYAAFTGTAAFAAAGKMVDDLHYNQTGLDEMGRGTAEKVVQVLFLSHINRILKLSGNAVKLP